MQFAGLAQLWSLNDVQLLSSAYAIDEARRNLAMDRPEAVQGLNRLLESVSAVDAPLSLELPENICLDPRDRPILPAAIHGKAGFLLTGDVRHLQHLYGNRQTHDLMSLLHLITRGACCEAELPTYLTCSDKLR
jgi:uncharacterized protein